MKTERKNHKKYKCDHCDKTFIVATTMNNHLKVYHENVKMEDEPHMQYHKKYKCDRCDKTFIIANTMKKHVKVHHINVNFYWHYFNKMRV